MIRLEPKVPEIQTKTAVDSANKGSPFRGQCFALLNIGHIDRAAVVHKCGRKYDAPSLTVDSRCEEIVLLYMGTGSTTKVTYNEANSLLSFVDYTERTSMLGAAQNLSIRPHLLSHIAHPLPSAAELHCVSVTDLVHNSHRKKESAALLSAGNTLQTLSH